MVLMKAAWMDSLMAAERAPRKVVLMAAEREPMKVVLMAAEKAPQKENLTGHWKGLWKAAEREHQKAKLMVHSI